MASTMCWVPSTRGSPVALRSMLGPRALTTASAPATARSIAAASVISPTSTRTPPHVAGTLPGFRTEAVTVAVGSQLVDDQPADSPGGPEDGDVHGYCSSCGRSGFAPKVGTIFHLRFQRTGIGEH